MIIGKKDLKKLQKSLPKKYRTILSNRTGFSSDYINKVISGTRNASAKGAAVIIDEAIILANETKTEMETKLEKNRELINQL